MILSFFLVHFNKLFHQRAAEWIKVPFVADGAHPSDTIDDIRKEYLISM